MAESNLKTDVNSSKADDSSANVSKSEDSPQDEGTATKSSDESKNLTQLPAIPANSNSSKPIIAQTALAENKNNNTA